MSDSQEEFEYESTVREEKEYRDISRSLDPEGDAKPGHRWCCNEWFKEGTKLNKHIPLHTKPYICEWGAAEPRAIAICTGRFRTKKDRDRHHRSRHRLRAKQEGFPTEFSCKYCGNPVSRADYLKRHYKTCEVLHPDKPRGKKKGKRVEKVEN